MDQEVAHTLAELERKLAQLERELTSIGRRATPPAASPPASGGPDAGAAPPGPGSEATEMPPEAFHRGASPTPWTPPAPSVLVDEAVEQRFSMEVRETPYGEIPAARDERRSIDLADLVRFRDRMQRTMNELIDEYSRLLSLRPPPGA